MRREITKKFEFDLLINGNIICQRYFNVKNYNREVLKSMDLRRCLDKCVNLINGEGCGWDIPAKETLRGKTWEYLWKGYNPYQQDYPQPERNEGQNEDIFTFQIKVDGRSVMETSFTGNYYPPKVKYDVDIRKTIPKIVREIQTTLSRRDPIMEYGEVEL